MSVATKRLKLALLRARQLAKPMLKLQFHPGYCPICARMVLFVKRGSWLRDDYVCIRCWSIPRQRAMIRVLGMVFPQWHELRIHESSPSGASSRKLQRECRDYIPTHYYLDTPQGSYKDGIRCENLGRMTFADQSFDLVITQDVFEHVLDPAPAFAEIARTLRPGGAHVFTVPYYPHKATLVRAVASPEGVRHLEKPDYHSNPIDTAGSLVVTEWGRDLADFIYETSRMVTSIYLLHDKHMGLAGEFLEVFVSSRGVSQ
jgi:SAM-dependent methyltransferase